MLYNPPSGSTDPNAPYVGKDVASGRQGSKLPPTVPEGTQREIVAIIAAAQAMGLPAPTNADLAQMLKAVRSGLLSRFPAIGTPDAIAIAPTPAYAALVEGMRFRVKIPGSGSSTTTTPTLGVNSLSAPIKRRDGSAPLAGDIIAGRVVEFEIDAAGNAVASGLISDTSSVLAALNITGNNRVVFPSAGTFTWTVPVGITRIYAQVWGAGGGGGSCSGSNSSGAGGNGGGYSGGVFTVTPGQVLTIVVGAGGAGYVATVGAAGLTGGTSSVGALISATGGGGGGGASSAGAVSGLYGISSNSVGNGIGGQDNVPGGQAANAYGPTPVMGSAGAGCFGTSTNAPSVSGGIAPNYPGGGGGGAGGGFGGRAGADGRVTIQY